jgi:hypothetical protein
MAIFTNQVRASHVIRRDAAEIAILNYVDPL